MSVVNDDIKLLTSVSDLKMRNLLVTSLVFVLVFSTLFLFP